VVAQLDVLVDRSGSTLAELSGLSTRSVAELLVEVGDPRRFTEGGFARFKGSAPLPASTAEGPGEPVRHRYNPGGNRRVNAILHRMAVTQAPRSIPPDRLTMRGRRAVKGWPVRAEPSEPRSRILDGDRWPRATLPPRRNLT
jgi:Transposase IS116/IS110/IS902 family